MPMVMCQKGPSLNQDKSGYLIYGSKEQVEEVRKEVKKRPFYMKEMEKVTWLGDVFVGGNSLKQSVIETIKERMGKSRGACIEIATIVSDLRAQAIGGFLTNIKLFEACVVPGLRYNAGTWTDMPWENFLLWFIWFHLRTGPGALKAGLRAETGMLSMEQRWKKRLTPSVLIFSSCANFFGFSQFFLHNFAYFCTILLYFCAFWCFFCKFLQTCVKTQQNCAKIRKIVQKKL